eukprot:TRINITY_DN3766_c0_g1_i1.p1 TRINITY_DN3766_c0_g1~~TRINITY_DN3766_c0_g1_i1.p1  ORF type:complete len:302 (+),score=88.24 TRINITY_DN3766_c0_g1_i1:74-979(+)
MANVHGFRDIERDPGRNRGGGGGGGAGGDPSYSMPFLVSTASSGNPRKESFFDMIKYVCCPSFRIYSFMCIISLVDIVVFVLELLYRGIIKGNEFLRPSDEALLDFGGKYPYNMRYKFEIWRFITPVFLHANFSHILYNLISQLIFGIPIEDKTGSVRIMIIYFISGIGGNLFSSLISSGISVGASTAVFGLLGSQLAFLIVNWRAFDYPGSGREKFLFIIIILIFFNFLFGVQNPKIDNWGHLGGLLVGIFLGLFVVKSIRLQQYEKKVKTIGMVFTAIFFFGGFALFYTVISPLPLVTA